MLRCIFGVSNKIHFHPSIFKIMMYINWGLDETGILNYFPAYGIRAILAQMTCNPLLYIHLKNIYMYVYI